MLAFVNVDRGAQLITMCDMLYHHLLFLLWKTITDNVKNTANRQKNSKIRAVFFFFFTGAARLFRSRKHRHVNIGLFFLLTSKPASSKTLKNTHKFENYFQFI